MKLLTLPTPIFFLEKHKENLEEQERQRQAEIEREKSRLRSIYNFILRASMAKALDCTPEITDGTNSIQFSINFFHQDPKEVNLEKVARYVRSSFKKLGWDNAKFNSKLGQIPPQTKLDDDPGNQEFPNPNYGKEIVLAEAVPFFVFEISCSSKIS